MSGARRLEASIVASALLHALVLGVALRGKRVTLRPPLVAIPVALVGGVGGGGGAASPASEPAPAPAPASAAPQAKPRPRPPAVARRPTRAPAAPPESGAPAGGAEGDGVAAARGGSGGGDGSGGDGSGGARVAYGTNPLPPYPLVARRLGKEGVVLLEVLVAPDGRAADVRMIRSSGFAPLDESAVTTVRERWRFVPARRDGVPVESRVTVPIRFRLAGEPG
ncbi:MAG: energy transducer TonB [Deltaproteobacteria bacterium]|nr:MAG: energy transducer TonB [Deltaproteobacteria bacterium]